MFGWGALVKRLFSMSKNTPYCDALTHTIQFFLRTKETSVWRFIRYTLIKTHKVHVQYVNAGDVDWCEALLHALTRGFELTLRVCRWTWWTGWTQRDNVSVMPALTRALTFPSASVLQSVCVFPLGTFFISHCPIVHLCPLLLLIMKNLFMHKSPVRVRGREKEGGVMEKAEERMEEDDWTRDYKQLNDILFSQLALLHW